MVHVPYKGGGPALVALMSGEVAMLFSNVSFTLPQVKAGKVRALAVSGVKRSAVAPELPTIAEAGVPGFEVTSWYGVLAPARTSKRIITSLHDAFSKALNAPEVKVRLANDGNEVVGSTRGVRGLYGRRGSEVGESGQAVGRADGMTCRYRR